MNCGHAWNCSASSRGGMIDISCIRVIADVLAAPPKGLPAHAGCLHTDYTSLRQRIARLPLSCSLSCSLRQARRSTQQLQTRNETASYQLPVLAGIASCYRHHQPFRAEGQKNRHKKRHCCQTVCKAGKQAAEKQSMEAQTFPEVGKGKTLLIIGGTGRVGASTAAALTVTHPNLRIVLGSQNKASYDDAVNNRPELKGLGFKVVNRDDMDSLTKALQECDVVLHTAGPFQRKNDCLVLEAAIQTKTPYIGDCPLLYLASQVSVVAYHATSNLAML